MITGDSSVLVPVLQEGSVYLNGIEKVLSRNIKASMALKNYISGSFGPNGLNKLIEQKTGKILVTSHSAIILSNIDYLHPVAKLVCTFAAAQEQELGDSVGFVILFSTELLSKSYDLIKQGFSISKVVDNFTEAGDISLEILQSLAQYKISDISNTKSIASLLCLFIGFKHPGIECYIVPQAAYACIKIFLLGIRNFSSENIRVIKIIGGNIEQTKTVSGMVLIKDTEGSVKSVKKAKIAIFSCNFISFSTEMKNSLIFDSIKEILCYSKNEFYNVEKKIQKIAAFGIKVVISSEFDETSLFYLNKYGIMALKIQSKFDMRRIAKICETTILTKIKFPLYKNAGTCDFIYVKSFGLQKITIFQKEMSRSKIFTIMIRASSTVVLDNIENAIYKMACVFKSLTRDNRFLPGAGACEIEVYKKLMSFTSTHYKGYKKHLIQKFAESFEVIPLTLIRNHSQIINKTITKLYHLHSKGNEFDGISDDYPFFVNIKKTGTWDLFISKYWAIKYSMEAFVSILTTSQIIMTKQPHQYM